MRYGRGWKETSKNKIYRVVVVFFCYCLLVSPAAAESISGIYLNVHRSGTHSLVYIDEAYGVVTIRLSGGHSGELDDVIVPSDCELRARGPLKDDSVIAFYVFEDRVDDVYVHIKFGDNELEVLNALPHFAGCGIHVRFYGKYKKHTCSEIKDIFHNDLPYYKEHPEELENLCQ
ncbi:hypothetical protein GO013_12600 [Pseudodesulfovibrio sp. JC047]|uniref:hypothetical protein n=1 Tax=Pseudodesulfovibrio sp. JC047 TaxID=2683199 RepID=UPI0013D3B4CD|nr:hypothetical protein [Pseudodesulfovibrio sp. JC047]NDV20251.1 hypothetical protein [Pseudodesulfovibrio sp. JC047]